VAHGNGSGGCRNRRARFVVVTSELGIDPGPQLRALHARILRADPALTLPALTLPPTTPPGQPAPPPSPRPHRSHRRPCRIPPDADGTQGRAAASAAPAGSRRARDL
jgi:hypothetical protein